MDHRPSPYYIADRPSPPPIATLPQSPSLSSNSSISSPGPTVLPSLLHSNHVVPSHYMSGSARHSHPYGAPPHPHYLEQGTISPPDVFASPVTPYSAHTAGGYDTHGTVATMRSPHAQTQGGYTYHPAQQFGLVYTDDASTKLNERVRRRCFNCCSTDTSTWRRSGLHPGKVVSPNFFIIPFLRFLAVHRLSYVLAIIVISFSNIFVFSLALQQMRSL